MRGLYMIRRRRRTSSASSRLGVHGLVTEAIAGILQRPARTALTIVGVVLGVGSFVAVLGLTSTARGQISQRFTALAATEVTVTEVPDAAGLRTASLFPADSDARVRSLNGVNAAGVFWTVHPDDITSVVGVPLPGERGDDYMPVVAASPGIFNAVHATFAQGRAFADVHDTRGELVAVLGSAAASSLGISGLDGNGPAILVNGTPITVIGIIADVDRHPELLGAVMLPRHTVEGLWGSRPDPSQPAQMVVDTQLGAAEAIAEQAALAIRPDLPEGFTTTAPPDPSTLRNQIDSDLSSLLMILACICLAIGAVGIANTTIVAVLERVHEIGLRRALGAKRVHIAAQFLAESTALGTIGGTIGLGIAIICMMLVAAAQQWTPVVDPAIALPAPLLGTLIGLLAGVYPAARAARVEPAEALSS
ncbi:ABC transporter permease [Plantactinospora sp. KBS50]|uniref:ABC transporter permease n=1 Tax=Plantactinospora sp. KBS50 TaxID=2024580 RepID=UPI000BAAB913|nr:ABC transporter permease [Plantactinospora sp. KBS50]ASW54548.1 hypothetical protein CIK06_10650 [Plantactinospora sp. KBS50]